MGPEIREAVGVSKVLAIRGRIFPSTVANFVGSVAGKWKRVHGYDDETRITASRAADSPGCI